MMVLNWRLLFHFIGNLQEVKHISQGHRTGKCHSQCSNLDFLAPNPMHFPLYMCVDTHHHIATTIIITTIFLLLISSVYARVQWVLDAADVNMGHVFGV